MSFLEHMPYYLRIIIMFVGVIAMLIQSVMIFRNFAAKFMDAKTKGNTLNIAVCLLLMFCLVVINTAHQRGIVGIYSPKNVNDLTFAFVVIGLLVGGIIFSFFSVWRYLTYDMRSINAFSIKEALDTLSAGISYGKSNGKIVLSNNMIHELAYMFIGRDIQDLVVFWNDLNEGKLMEGWERELYQGRVILSSEKGTWEIQKNLFTVNKVQYTEIVALDVSETSIALKELTKLNETLEASAEQLRKMNLQVERIRQEKELFYMKANFHDTLGQSAAITCRYLEKNRSEEGIEAMVDMLRETISAIRNIEVKSLDSNINELIRISRYAGATMVTEGAYPKNKEREQIMSMVLREAVNNAIRHGKATYIKVLFECTDGAEDIMTVINNGTMPELPIIENGGLFNIRKTVEEAGGEMTITYDEVFVLKVTL
ncbi:MAG: hypothetical protein Q4B18_05275 [Bacillota bacterium]|nr:hypothetical protein [Bacillota bacterium]